MDIRTGTIYQIPVKRTLWGHKGKVIVDLLTKEDMSDEELKGIAKEYVARIDDTILLIDKNKEAVFEAIKSGIGEEEKPGKVARIWLDSRSDEISFFVTSKEDYCYHVYIRSDNSFYCNCIS